MRLQQEIENQIAQNMAVTYLKMDNESHLHAGPATESHFKMVLVSDDFVGLSKVKRHQKVYQILAQQMPQFHALALHTFAPDEWNEQVPASPPCAGKN